MTCAPQKTLDFLNWQEVRQNTLGHLKWYEVPVHGQMNSVTCQLDVFTLHRLY